jgi:hypothetical protein
MFKLNSPRAYALLTGFLLFAFGFFEFAFRSNTDMSSGFLLASLALGFWGIVVGVGAE